MRFIEKLHKKHDRKLYKRLERINLFGLNKRLKKYNSRGLITDEELKNISDIIS